MFYNTQSPVLIKIRSIYPGLKKIEKKVADFILDNSEKVIYGTLAQISREAKVSEASFVRFCQTLGFSGLTDIRVSLATTVGHKNQELTSDFSLDRNTLLKDVPEKVIAHSIFAIKDILAIFDKEEFVKAVNILKICKRVAIFAVANAASVADDAMNKFLRIGKDVVLANDSHLQISIATALTSNDVAIGISHSGRTKSTIDALKCAKEAGATIICITNHDASLITEISDIKLLTADYEKNFNSETMVSRLSQLVIIDMLYIGIVLQDYDKYLKIIENQNKALLSLAY
jgi:DNA-binding MurR/RpiR family transcriptional regulator